MWAQLLNKNMVAV